MMICWVWGLQGFLSSLSVNPLNLDPIFSLLNSAQTLNLVKSFGVPLIVVTCQLTLTPSLSCILLKVVLQPLLPPYITL